jgi:hypothetical protein
MGLGKEANLVKDPLDLSLLGNRVLLDGSVGIGGTCKSKERS